jgi:radical SAM protein with 4Fe4S-binding SPASM domain
MQYFYKTPFFSYFLVYFNNDLGFRDSHIYIFNKSVNKDFLDYKEYNNSDFISSFFSDNNIYNTCFDIIGSENHLYPLYFQLELTDCCNLKCDYCYRDAKFNLKSKFCDFDKFKERLLQFKKKGLREICVTGGEPTLHENFVEFMCFLLNNFESVELITNGTNTNILHKFVKSVDNINLKKLNLSMSFNRWFRDLDKIDDQDFYLYKTIYVLKKYVPIRIICTDIDYNVEKKNIVKKKLLDLGVSLVDFSYVSPIGRGKNKINESIYIDKFINNNLDGFFKKDLRINLVNCGLLLKHSSVDPDGNIRPCALFPLNFKIGNIFENLDFSENSFLFEIPEPNKDICGECDFYKYCVGCIYKGLYNSKVNCKYKKYIMQNNPQILKFYNIEKL